MVDNNNHQKTKEQPQQQNSLPELPSNKDVVDDDDNIEVQQKGSGDLMKSVVVGTNNTGGTNSNAATNVAMGIKREMEAIGNDVLADVKDASNFVMHHKNHVTQQPHSPRHRTNRFSMFTMINPSKTHLNHPDPEQNQQQPPPIMDMFDKTASALLSSVAIYAVADIRTLVRQYRERIIGNEEMINDLMTLPIEDVSVMIIVLKNVSLLKEMMKPGELDFYLSAVQRSGKELQRKAELKMKESIILKSQPLQLEDDQEPQNISPSATNDSTTTTTTNTNNYRSQSQRKSIFDLSQRNNKPQQKEQEQQSVDQEPTVSTTTDTTGGNSTTNINTNNRRQQQRRSVFDLIHNKSTSNVTNKSSSNITTDNNTKRRQNRRSIFDSHQSPLAILTPRTIEVFDDANSATELVYAITIKRDIKEILVSFRGSVTSRDWRMDGKMFLTNVPNPILEYDQDKLSIPQSKTIGLHAGFYEYLFGIKKKNDINKYQQIVNHLHRLIDHEPTIRDYSINVTGHSLGGALAIIFSFFLAFEKRLMGNVNNATITCINFASPKSGNIQFAKAFQELELQKKIICLRVANHKDLITERPDRLTCWTFCLQDAIFRHVGIELLLYPERLEENQQNQKCSFWKYLCCQRTPKTHRITYPRIRRSRLSQLTDDLLISIYHTFQCTASVTCGCFIHDYMNTHSCNEYINRVETSTTVLQNIPMQHMFDAYHNIITEESSEFVAFRRHRSNNFDKNNNNEREEVGAISEEEIIEFSNNESK